ncbi:MAG: divergent PAP2 family protein [Anaerolineae bacterium]|nr:MAG: divergent PAP2 family protein [Anaerolineae bacterium]
MNLLLIFQNRVLWSALIAWGLAQTLKIPLTYLTTRRWDWSLLLRAGGMPSSHSALVTAATHGVGLYLGFDHPLFAVAFAFTMVVVYDATGVRRQAGMQAQKINVLVNELLSGHPLSQDDLREVLGHTPLEALAGVLLGLVVSTLVWFVWR